MFIILFCLILHINMPVVDILSLLFIFLSSTFHLRRWILLTNSLSFVWNGHGLIIKTLKLLMFVLSKALGCWNHCEILDPLLSIHSTCFRNPQIHGSTPLLTPHCMLEPVKIITWSRRKGSWVQKNKERPNKEHLHRRWQVGKRLRWLNSTHPNAVCATP